MQTAKDYFFERNGETCPPHHQINLEGLMALRNGVAEISDHRLAMLIAEKAFQPVRFSNHHGIEELVSKIETKNADWIAGSFFEDLFVGIDKSPLQHAAAYEKSRTYRGKLIIYSRGLLQAVILVSEALSVFMHEFNDDKYDHAPELIEFLDGLLSIFSIWRAADGYGELGDASAFRKKYPADLQLSIPVAIDADLFIVGHEIAHHLMGDTGHDHIKSEDLSALAQTVRSTPMRFGDMAENLADAIAINLFLGSPSERMAYDQMDLMRAMFGSLTACTAISLLSTQPYQSVGGYPAATERFNWAMATVSMHSKLAVMTGAGSIDGHRRVESARLLCMNFFDLLNRERISLGEIVVR